MVLFKPPAIEIIVLEGYKLASRGCRLKLCVERPLNIGIYRYADILIGHVNMT